MSGQAGPPHNAAPIPRIILIGLRCSGKSSVARLLARTLHSQAVDLDDLTLGELGQSSVAEAWRLLGEGAWRKAEAAALGRVLQTPGGIVALGGGTPMIDSVRCALLEDRDRTGSRIFYLRAQPRTLAQRWSAQPGDRPPLTGASAAEEMEQVFAQRDEVYRMLATTTIETDDLSPAQIAELIARECRQG